MSFARLRLVSQASVGHPEWFVIILGLACWATTVWHASSLWGHALHHRGGPLGELVAWHVMVLAMMLPVIWKACRALAIQIDRDPARWLGIASFVVGYLGPWSVVGVLAVAIRFYEWIPPQVAATGTCAIATAWAIPWFHGGFPNELPDTSRFTTRTATCAPLGEGALLGSGFGLRCVLNCWPLMLACALSGHDLVAVMSGGAAGVVQAERGERSRWMTAGISTALTAYFASR